MVFPPTQPTEHRIPCSFRWYWSGSSWQVPRCFSAKQLQLRGTSQIHFDCVQSENVYIKIS